MQVLVFLSLIAGSATDPVIMVISIAVALLAKSFAQLMLIQGIAGIFLAALTVGLANSQKLTYGVTNFLAVVISVLLVGSLVFGLKSLFKRNVKM